MVFLKNVFKENYIVTEMYIFNNFNWKKLPPPLKVQTRCNLLPESVYTCTYVPTYILCISGQKIAHRKEKKTSLYNH